jgi:dual-specificity kinase
LRSSRRQQHAPDWGSFYKNGVPRATEVIVIDDSPEPAAALPPQPPPHARTRLNGDTHTLPGSAAAGSAGRKRKYDDTASQASYQNARHANDSTRRPSATNSYQDRDTLYAPSTNTSTDDSGNRAAPPKRKRVTKTQYTNGVGLKRQDTRVLRGDHVEYRGLGKRVTKASAVSVRAIHVRILVARVLLWTVVDMVLL